MDTIKWNDVYLQLYAYTDQLLKASPWFKKGETDSYLKGKQVHDYIADAIEKHLKAPEKYDPSSGRSLVNYLKIHIIRSLVGNDVKSEENKTSSDILSIEQTDDENEHFVNVEALLPFASALFDQEIDYKNILKEIENELEDDDIAKLIFREVRCNGLNRRDVLEEQNMKESEYDNGMKRLRTVLKNIAKKYDLS